MKKILKYIVPLFCMALGSCDFLEEDPNSFVQQGEFFKSEEQCRSAVNSTYTGLRSVYSSTLFTHLEGTTDLIQVPSISDVNAILDINPSGCNISRTVWSQGYKCIMYSNYAVAGIETSPIDSTARMELLAEAKTMRAFWYYLLTSCFGDVPFYTEDVSDAEVMNKVAKYPRMSAYETRRALIEDLQSCFPYDTAGTYLGATDAIRTYDMPEKGGQTGRAGWAMGMTLIGKMALWNANHWDCGETVDSDSAAYWYQTALDALLKVDKVYGESLSKYPLEDLKFKYKNTPESIFEIQHTYVNGQLNYSGGLATNCMPSYSSSSEKFDGVEIKELGKDMKVGTCNRPTKYFYQGIQPDNGMDKRTDINMGFRYDGKSFSSGKSKPWMGPKFWCPEMYQTNDSNNYPVFRYADVVLMIAECYWGLRDEENFAKYLNIVKNRAGLSYTETPSEDWKRAHKELRDERARELFGEFQRKFDLVRWGIWYESVTEYTDNEELLKNIKPCHRYLPIHDTQVIYSDYALDNNEYNKYGL